ncbi:hypothetical protein FA048_04755 [Pedobacter polaris]|uniref:Uncharacterized protein n=1 Tax=Pedobacter polaris TaxID=2571273 RepID=A0A4U1CUR6_9SPHI|nr:hypothetical protein [Pedobacter polaris]TKC12931.1 hypothetical protein FA048_04755 [Pedobacter polaris]
MTKYLNKLILVTLVSLFMFSACKKSDKKPQEESRTVKYEITGNFTGKLTVIYNDNVTGNTVLTEVPLPFSKTVTYGSNVKGIGFGANSSTVSAPGQNAKITIYSHTGAVLATDTQPTGASGELSSPTIAYIF